jgi:hypothetical protein
MNKSIGYYRKEYEKKRRVYGDPGNLKIKDFISLDIKIPRNQMRRFCKPYNLKLPCPECGLFDNVYEDCWPPNHSSTGGSGYSGDSGVTNKFAPESSIKHICSKCKIQFIVTKSDSEIEKFKNYIKIFHAMTESQEVTRIKPLHLIYNFYMTDSDYEDELFYDTYGHYCFMIYG